jgi:hypothetical protein
VTKRLLRIGIVLLGFTVSFGSIMALGVGTVALVAGTLVVTLVVITWLGNRVKLGAARSPLIGTGFAICGASAIAAMEETARPTRRTSRSGSRWSPSSAPSPWCCCRCWAARWASATFNSASGPRPASTRSARWSLLPAPEVPPSWPSPSSSS